jgi:hypothetical protein
LQDFDGGALWTTIVDPFLRHKRMDGGGRGFKGRLYRRGDLGRVRVVIFHR